MKTRKERGLPLKVKIGFVLVGLIIISMIMFNKTGSSRNCEEGDRALVKFEQVKKLFEVYPNGDSLFKVNFKLNESFITVTSKIGDKLVSCDDIDWSKKNLNQCVGKRFEIEITCENYFVYVENQDYIYLVNRHGEIQSGLYNIKKDKIIW